MSRATSARSSDAARKAGRSPSRATRAPYAASGMTGGHIDIGGDVRRFSRRAAGRRDRRHGRRARRRARQCGRNERAIVCGAASSSSRATPARISARAPSPARSSRWAQTTGRIGYLNKRGSLVLAQGRRLRSDLCRLRRASLHFRAGSSRAPWPRTAGAPRGCCRKSCGASPATRRSWARARY